MTAFALRTTFAAVAISAVMLAGTAPVVAGDNLKGNDRDSRLVIYFTRHAEKQTVMQEFAPEVPVYTSVLDGNGEVEFIPADNIVNPPIQVFSQEAATFGGTTTDNGVTKIEVCGLDKCAEELSLQGEKRAILLADWFAGRGITSKLDAVYATHKTRTQQTVMPTATASGLEVTALNPGVSELAPEGTTISECSTLEAIESAQAMGHDTILIAGHSGTLYDIMGNGVEDCGGLDGLGLDTGNTVADIGNLDRFPKDSKGKVRDFGDIWKVVIKRNGEVKFQYRVNLQQPARLNVDNVAR